jgi:tetratricopeptide (TPR) repeat protein
VAAFRRALDLAGDAPSPMLLMNAGDAMARSGDSAGIDLLRSSVALATSTGDAHLAAVASAVSSMFEVGARVLTVREAVPRVERAIAELELSDDHEALARAKASLSYVLWGAGRLGDSGRFGEEVVEHWRAAGQHPRVARAIAVRSGTLVDGPTPVPDAISLCEDWMLEVGESPNARRALVESLAMLAVLDGRYDDARRQLGEAQAIGEELGQVLDNLGNLGERAEIEADAGDFELAESLLAGVPERIEAFGTIQGPVTYAQLARYRTLRGDPAAGLRTLLPEPANDDDVFIRSSWYRAAALAHLGLGQLDDAERHALSAVDALESTDLLTHRADAMAILGDVVAARGNAVAARKHLGTAVRLYEQKQATARLSRARARLAELSTPAGPVA